MTIKQVFSRLHDQYMRQMDIPLKFLAFAGDRRCTPNPHRLPSWLPDYSTEAQHWPSGCLKRDLYMADKGMRTVSRIKADEVLLVTGCECDMITRVESRKIFVEPRFEAFYRDYAENADRSLMYPTGITKFQAFVRTLFFDMIDSRTPCRMDALDFETQARMVGLLILNFDYREQVDIESEELRTELFRNALTVLFSEQDLTQLGEQIDKTVERMKSVFMNSSFVKRILRAKRPSRRRLFHTKHGYIGLGPKDASIGDKVCVVGGSPMPILLRKLEDRYEHVGTCFVLGYMDGEVGKLITEGKLVEQEFEIV
ncbi:hypothetical protein BKA66DRAFT_576172 [Pyrenochaeta sp. MPI-SDFR-AT-0127]|nr:hypothetical protein BKA66DRAFT_576172 [Pyrenochaeta sp. MPI-SDFR-AT-0127]